MARDLPDLFLCSWGDIQLFVSEIEWEDGETQVVHQPAAGDDHSVQPRGSQIKTATAHLMFDEFSGARETGSVAFRRFQATTKERRIFTHPMTGSYFARIGRFTPHIDSSSVISATCEIIPDGIVQPVSPAGAGASGVSGERSVAAAADVMSQSLADLGLGFPSSSLLGFDFTLAADVNINLAFSANVNLTASANVSATASGSASVAATASVSASAAAQGSASALAFAGVYARALAIANATAVASTSGMASANAFAFAYASAALDADARASVASWNEEDTPARKVQIDTARLSDSISTMIDTGGFEDDLQLFPAYQAAILLGAAIRDAAIAATSDAPAVFVLRVQTPCALLPLCARVYGGQAAQGRADQVELLNDIPTPGWLPPGDYLFPAKP